MNIQSLANVAKRLEKYIVKRSPEILMAMGISGFFVAGVTAVRQTPKALRLIDQKEMDEDRRLNKLEVIQTTWKCYAGPIVTSIISAGCIIGSNRIGSRRHTALVAAYTISETALKEYQEKAVEVVGKKKEQEIRDAVAKEKILSNPVCSKEIISTGKGDTLFFEPLSGRYFISDVESIRRAVNELNREMLNDMYISLNEFYYALHLHETQMGESVGWNIEKGLIELDFSSQLTEEMKPCIVIGHRVPPFYGFNRGY